MRLPLRSIRSTCFSDGDRSSPNRNARWPDALAERLHAAAVRDPRQSARILPAFDSGDHVHPNDAGYRALAAAVALRLFGD